ncbi:MAG: UDP-N-acetylglucosamine-peptide N-acetylglucosaminyltransferase [Roseateles sp.]|uniref:O-linked N-acetylglucosamine transferase, SPINDLY family protein n=1 Tax=Roseateles sp. TaxID=1971397 RepID=UPI0039E8412F
MPSADQTALKLLQRARPLLLKQQWHDAIPPLKQVLRLRPRDAVLWQTLARACRGADRTQDWLRAAEQAFTHAGGNDGLAQEACEDAVDAALAAHDPAQAVALAERLAPALRDARPRLLRLMGTALNKLGRPQEAVAPLMRAIALQLDDADAHMELGFSFYALKMHAEAAECFRTVCMLYPQHVGALAYMNDMEQLACRWEGFETRSRAFFAALAGASRPSCYVPPFAALLLPHTSAQLLAVSRFASQNLCRGIEPLPSAAPRAAGRRLHVAYLSNDFHGHATASLITQVLESHDRGRFEVSLLSHGDADGSELRQRLVRAGERFEEMGRLSLPDMARRIRALEVDILVDLKGHTAGSRTPVLAYRPAPLQVAWLGFAGTCGMDEADYVIGDPVVTPLADAPWYTEKIAQMPHSYQPNDGLRSRAAPPPRRELGLPEDALVLLSANQVGKLNPAVFDAWMAVMRRVPQAVLWQLTGGDASDAELRREMQARDVAPQRLVVMPRAALPDHLRRLGAADLALDTWPYNGHTTTSDALWSGVPVVAVRGHSFPSRVSESLLRAAGLPELVCDTVPDFVELASALAADPARRASLRERVLRARDEAPLFDGPRFARDLEALYERMWTRHQAGLPPEALQAA